MKSVAADNGADIRTLQKAIANLRPDIKPDAILDDKRQTELYNTERIQGLAAELLKAWKNASK